MNGSLPPANSWTPAEPCSSDGSSSPSIVYSITLTGVPATIGAAAGGGYVWSLTLNDGGAPPNFTIDHYDGSGTLIDHPIVVSGDDGSTTFNDPVYLSRDPLAPLEAATKEYVDANSLTGQEPPSGPGVYGRSNVGAGSWTSLAPPNLAYLPLAGGYLSGGIGFNGPTNQRFIGGVTPAPGNLWRWGVTLGDTTAESGSNNGSNFVVTSYNDAGGGATAQLTITRTGSATFSQTCIFPSQVIVNGRLVLGSPAGLQIAGGVSGDTLITDGFGNLIWAAGGSGGGVPEAPLTGGPYGRQAANWVTIPPPMTDAPAISQIYGRYNNGWVQVGSQFLAIAGGAMTGAIIFNTAGSARAIAGQASGAMRWAEYIGDATAESGGNSGSNFSLVRYSDAGAIIDTPLTISRATGLATFADGVSVPTPAPADNSNLAANTSWVTAAIGALSSPSNATPSMNGTAAPGTAMAWSRGDHVHPSDTSRVMKAGDTMTGNLAAPSLSGPTAGTAPVAAASPTALDNSLNLATTAWVNQWVNANARWGDNRIINGNFSVNQRAYVSGTALAAAAYGHDRWKAGASGCTYTFTAAVPDTTATITAGTLTQVIEAAVIEGGVYTLSWTGTAQARIYQGTPSGAYAASPVTIAGLSAGLNTIAEFNTGSVGLVKLESGPFHTPFNRQSMAKTLADCQRYYCTGEYIWSGQVANATGYFMQAFLPTTMRASPTIVLANATASSFPATVGAVTLGTVNGFREQRTANATATAGWFGSTYTASAEL